MSKQRGYIDYLRPELIKARQAALALSESTPGFSSIVHVAEANALTAVINAFDVAQKKYAADLAKATAKNKPS